MKNEGAQCLDEGAQFVGGDSVGTLANGMWWWGGNRRWISSSPTKLHYGWAA